jgi:hypothetical protein
MSIISLFYDVISDYVLRWDILISGRVSGFIGLRSGHHSIAMKSFKK